MSNTINTDEFSTSLRDRSIDVDRRKLLVTNYHGSEQEKDLTLPANCNGYGRIRHFRREASDGWPPNPLPIDPAIKALGVDESDLMKAQVFQNASCNWRCWYCYVPFSLLAANEKHAAWLSASELIGLYLDESSCPRVIDLTGGQQDLVPEWIPWMMAELRSRGLEEQVYLWSDDNLSNDYFWRFVSGENRELVANYKNYGKVCCFKGFNPHSFAFNTCASPDLFPRQFDLMRRYVEWGIDVYGYVTFTTPSEAGIREDMKRFVDSLQSIHKYLPLRVVPLEIRTFTPVAGRLREEHHAAMKYQQNAVAAWQEELEIRYTTSELSWKIADVLLA